MLGLLFGGILIVDHFRIIPYGDDQSEYSTNLKINYLPHAPYFLHFLLGKLFSLIIDPAIALSIISALSAFSSIILYYLICKKYIKLSESVTENKSRIFAIIATVLFSFNDLFLFLSGYQEVYALQLLFILLSIFLIISHNYLFAGVCLGLAFSTHTGTIFLFPAIVYILFLFNSSRHNTVIFIIGILSMVVFIYGYFYMTLAIPDNIGRLSYFTMYIKGIAPKLNLVDLLSIKKLTAAFIMLLNNLTSADNVWGYNKYYVVFGYFSVIMSISSNIRYSVFWVFYMFLYLIYESLIGCLDQHLYVVYLIPAFAYFVAYFTFRLYLLSKKQSILGKIKAYAPFLVVLYFVYPAYCGGNTGNKFIGITKIKEGILNHYDQWVLSIIWANQNLPAESILITPAHRSYALYSYYADKLRQITTFDHRIYSIKRFGNGKYTPKRPETIEDFSEIGLISLYNSGKVIYALESNPLKDIYGINSKRFNWTELKQVEILNMVDGVPVPTILKGHLKNRHKDSDVRLWKLEGISNES